MSMYNKDKYKALLYLVKQIDVKLYASLRLNKELLQVKNKENNIVELLMSFVDLIRIESHSAAISEFIRLYGLIYLNKLGNIFNTKDMDAALRSIYKAGTRNNQTILNSFYYTFYRFRKKYK